MRALVVCVCTLLLSSARAQAPTVVRPSLETECASSYPARVADAKQAVLQFSDFMDGYKKAKPALEWFEAHCRFLNELEIAVRKLDDENAFACDPKAKGRPKGLTSQLVLSYSTLPSVGAFQGHQAENNMCLEADRAARVALVISADQDLAGGRHRLAVLCYADERPTCVTANAQYEAARAQGKL